MNGRVGDYENTEEGAEIRVYCFDKLSENVLRCLNSSWYPDPAEIDCISPTPARLHDIHIEQEMFITVKLTIFLSKWHCTAIQLQYKLNILSTPFLWLSTTQYSNSYTAFQHWFCSCCHLSCPTTQYRYFIFS